MDALTAYRRQIGMGNLVVRTHPFYVEKSAVLNSNFSSIKMSFMLDSEAIRNVNGHHQMNPFT